MKCPKCMVEHLKEVPVKDGKVHVDVCPKCKGIWFDIFELESLIPVAAKDMKIPVEACQNGRKCPRGCGELHSFKYPQTHVKIEMCKECAGIWLDENELREIRTVRTYLQKNGELEKGDPAAGFKGALLAFIDSAFSNLTNFNS